MGAGSGVISLWWLVGLITSALMVLGWVGWWFFVRGVPVSVQPRIKVPDWREQRQTWHAAMQAGHGRLMFAGGVVLLLAIGMAYAAGGWIRLDPLAAMPGLFGTRIGQAFAPEGLVPPPPMPPQLFVTQEDPGLESADRDWAKLDAGFRQAVLMTLEGARRRGVQLALLEGYRSPERQDRLASLGPSVTRAGAFQSKHQYGLAADLVPVREGRLFLSEADPWAAEAYRVLGEEAERAGLVWGGRWTLRDLGHVEAAGSTLASR